MGEGVGQADTEAAVAAGSAVGSAAVAAGGTAAQSTPRTRVRPICMYGSKLRTLCSRWARSRCTHGGFGWGHRLRGCGRAPLTRPLARREE